MSVQNERKHSKKSIYRRFTLKSCQWTNNVKFIMKAINLHPHRQWSVWTWNTKQPLRERSDHFKTDLRCINKPFSWCHVQILTSWVLCWRHCLRPPPRLQMLDEDSLSQVSCWDLRRNLQCLSARSGWGAGTQGFLQRIYPWLNRTTINVQHLYASICSSHWYCVSELMLTRRARLRAAALRVRGSGRTEWLPGSRSGHSWNKNMKCDLNIKSIYTNKLCPKSPSTIHIH